MQDFAVGSQQVQWVLNASLLPLAGLLVLGGRLGDIFGRRRIFIIGTAVFTGASAVGGLAPVFGVLLACRVLQGAGGALMLPNTVAIVSGAFPDAERGRALGLTVALVGLVFGLSQSQAWGWASPEVLGPLIISVCAGAAFLRAERTAASPLMNLPLLRRHPNYLGATVRQFVVGMGLALLFPLLLILNLQMSPALAGLALIPATLPMVFVAPLAGRWYDRAGGRPPLLPGFLLYGIGLALILTVNDPVSLDTVPAGDQGQASGVSATAEQFGGAVGIAGLRPRSFCSSLAQYLLPARAASQDGYSAALAVVSVLCLVAIFLMIRLIRKPPPEAGLAKPAPAQQAVSPQAPERGSSEE